MVRKVEAQVKVISLIAGAALTLLASCQERVEHTAAAVYERDSASMMTTYGVNTLISDSGVIKYRIVTEQWDVNTTKNPQRWTFAKGLFLEQFDEKFHVQSYIQCDTAYYYNEKKLWELRSRVHVTTKDGLDFRSEELFWDENKHEIYSHVFSRLVTPDRTLQGHYFRSDERMTKYFVYNTKGSFEKDGFKNDNDNLSSSPDSVKTQLRPRTNPSKKSPQTP